MSEIQHRVQYFDYRESMELFIKSEFEIYIYANKTATKTNIKMPLG